MRWKKVNSRLGKRLVVLSGTAVFLKQFGERRTGTNYLRKLLSENFYNVVVLMHVLGDKHSAPSLLSPPDSVSEDAAYQWVRGLTLSSPAETTRIDDADQESYMRSIAVPLVEAVHRGELGFVLNVKDPYAWGASLCKYFHFLPRGLPPARSGVSVSSAAPRIPAWIRELEEATCEKLRAACHVSNGKHRAWLEYLEGYPSRSTIVKFEDLLTHPVAILDDIKRKHHLEESGRRIENISQSVFSAVWDHLDAPLLEKGFDGDYYREHRYLEALTPVMVDTITKSIDWSLVSSFGYRPI